MARLGSAAVMMEFTDAKVQGRVGGPLKAPEQDIATFLLARGDYAWLGYGWQGCTGGNKSATSRQTEWAAGFYFFCNPL